MKKVFKWLGIIVLLIVILAVAGIGYLKTALPNVGAAPILNIERTPERIARGKYLANSVAVCMDCHSSRDWSKFAAPLVPGTEGAGGEKFGRELGFPGEYYSRNITPHGIGSWTDGELYRLITTGVRNDGEPIFPVMPYHYYGRMADEDIYSIIAYIRTLPSIDNDVPERVVDFPFSLIMRTIPVKGTPAQEVPQPSNAVEYGKYLVNAAACRECHTPEEKGQVIPELEFGGGRVFELPGGTLRSPNITPHATGLGNWTPEQFVARFKLYQDSAYRSPHIDFMHEFNSIMPWMMYSTMTDQDLSAIFQYLKTIKPIENQPVKWTPRS
ncbi:MAG: c-type cytochrome [Chitinophagaceae bacterium]|nr:c-type cytochrome [Chitinophagaceae bacterium]MCB9046056.1 c-type cytochrome [Chitinophagales bacterium]